MRETYQNGIYVKGRVLLSESTVLHPGVSFFGTILLGPHCEIGPGSIIYGPTFIESDAMIGPNVEIRRSILFTEVKIAHIAYIGHSIIGRRVNIGANLLTAVRNLKRKHVHLKIEDNLCDTGETHFGTIIADDTEFGVNVTVMPGRMILNTRQIPANTTVYKNC
ncbi:MAG: hypothetical protein AB1861_21850 [Cyanobacteriota bacterium]